LIAKPDGLADARLEDYFDLTFETLPHKVSSSLSTSVTPISKTEFLSQILTADKFEATVARPRKRFTGESHTET
jgi:hypothetical protein